MLLTRLRPISMLNGLSSRRMVSTLSNNPYIKVFPNASINNSHLLTYLDTNPPSQRLAIGSSTANPPTPQSFSENHEFLSILNEVLAKHAAQDPQLQSQAQAFAGPGGATLGSGGRRKGRGAGLGGGGGAGGGGGGGASAQGGAGGGGMGATCETPDYGRIAWPEDILGSIEVDGTGQIVGEFQPSGTYRIITNEGILGLSDFIRTKLVERLQKEERNG
ncbi:hypothetical protein PG990_007487 [Apiospora arundinis]